jgi:hypothetical protein
MFTLSPVPQVLERVLFEKRPPKVKAEVCGWI